MVEILVSLLGVYFLLGIIFALPFLVKGVQVIDPAAVEGSRGFKFMVFPGVVLFWPYLLKRWLRKQGPPEERSNHRRS